MKIENKRASLPGVIKSRLILFPIFVMVSFLPKLSYSRSYVSLDIISTLTNIQNILMHIGPTLSALLFILAGIFFAIGQLFPSYQRASFHTTAIDMIIGAIIVAALSVASGSFALASTHLLVNVTNST